MKQLDAKPEIFLATKYLLQTGTLLTPKLFLPSNPGVIGLATDQLQLSIDDFLRGHIAKEWATIQGQYYHTIQSPRSEDKSAAAFVINLWEIYFYAWNHCNKTFHQSKTKKDSIYNIQELN